MGDLQSSGVGVLPNGVGILPSGAGLSPAHLIPLRPAEGVPSASEAGEVRTEHLSKLVFFCTGSLHDTALSDCMYWQPMRAGKPAPLVVRGPVF